MVATTATTTTITTQSRLAEYENTFKKGTIVEVSSEDEGLRGSWYTATVLRAISRKTHKLLVEYHNLLASNDAASKPLREFVDALLVRPLPPREPHRVYRLMEDVDAFHNDGWWEGVVVSRRLLDANDSADVRSVHFSGGGGNTKEKIQNKMKMRYSVFFRCSREQIEFGESDLRLHREWVRGNSWVPPFEPLNLNLNLNLRSSPSSGQRKRNGEDGRNCNQERATRGGGERDVRRRSIDTATKQDVKNGQCTGERSSSNHITNDIDAFLVREGTNGKLMISSNGACENGLATNGNLEEPRMASNHTGKVVCGLKSFVVVNFKK